MSDTESELTHYVKAATPLVRPIIENIEKMLWDQTINAAPYIQAALFVFQHRSPEFSADELLRFEALLAGIAKVAVSTAALASEMGAETPHERSLLATVLDHLDQMDELA